MPRGNPQLERNRRIVEMRKSGLLPREIARRLGVTKNVVIGVTNRAGLAVPGLQYACAAKGEQHAKARLTEEAVRMIRERYVPRSRTDGCRAIATELGVSHRSVWMVLQGRTWGHVR